MQHARFSLPVALLLAAGCSSGSAGSSIPVLPESSTTNTTLSSIGPVQFVGGRALLRVEEYNQGDVDLNGDGDTLDSIVHLYDGTTGATKNYGWTAFAYRLTERYALLQIAEAEAGVDLDGDGDANSLVLLVEDLETGLRRFTELRDASPVGFPMVTDGRWVLIGRTGVNSLAIDLATGETQDLRHPVSGFYTGGLQVGGDRAVFSTFETTEDLNGDGDTSDSVLVVADLLTRTVEVPPFGLEAGELLYDGQGLLVFQAFEQAGGALDLNGDGDTEDRVDVILNLESRVALGLPGEVTVSPRARFAGDFVAVQISEAPGSDFNFDGDTEDNALALYDRVTSDFQVLPLSVDPDWFLSATHLVFAADEARNGEQDLDGDGDRDGLVVHAVELATGTIRNLGQEVDPHCACALVLEGSGLAVLAGERPTGTSGGGDPGVPESADPRLFIHDLARGTRRDLGFEPTVLQSSFLRSPGNRFAFTVFTGTGGSLLGQESYIYDFASGQVTSTGLRIVDMVFDPDGAFAARVSEGGLEDLNGDGDLSDFILLLGQL